MVKRVREDRRVRVFVWLLGFCAAVWLTMHAFSLLAKPSGLLGKLDVKYVVLDLQKGGYTVSPALAQGKEGERFETMVARLKPYAAITGTYYDPDYKPLGDIVIDGKVVCRGGQRQGIGFTSAGKIKFLERKPNTKFDWTGYRAGIACGPRIVRGGKKDINVKRDGFSSKANTVEAWRCAVGATREGKLVMCVVKEQVTLSTLAEVMLELNAVDAVNMDGGSVCALYENGKYHAHPVSNMTNILAVYKRSK